MTTKQSAAGRRVAFASLAVAVTVVAAAAVALFALAMPADDDWMRAGRWGPDRFGHGHPGLGWWQYVYGFIYLHWQGRWASCGIEAAVLPAVDPTRWYPLLVGAVAAVDVACLAVVCRWFTRGQPWGRTLAVTAVAAALVWAGLPSVAEGMYWFTGAVENTTAVLLAAALVAAVSAAGEAGGVLGPAAVAVAAVGVCGFHELYAGGLCLALAIGLARNLGRPAARAWAAAVVGATVGLAVVVLAPGNGHRAVHDATPHARPLAYAVRLAARLLAHYGPRWVLDPKLLAASAWVACCPWLEAGRVPWAPSRVPLRAAVPAAGAVVVGVGFLAPCYAFGHVLPDRTLSGVWLMFVAAWLVGVYVWTRPVADPMAAAAPYRRAGGAAVAAVVLAGSLLASGNVRRAASDLRGPARPWRAAVVARFDLLRGAGVDHAAVTVPRLPRTPQSFLSGETTSDRTDWRNFGLADYFGTGPLTVGGTTDAGGR